MDFRGLVLLAAGVALSIFGFQQSAMWGWSDARTVGCVAAGAALLVVFVLVERRTESPLIDVRIFRIRPFAVENAVLGVSNLVFIPVFFFASEYAQIGLGKSASSASLVLLYFFLGFVAAAQVGGRMLDRIGAKRPVVLGCALAAVGFWVWSRKVTALDFGPQIWCVVLAGAGMGFMLGPASTDAVNRASRLSYGEATGITQTVRNYAASLGLAILGSMSVSQFHSRLTTSLTERGMSGERASSEATRISQSHAVGGTIPQFVRVDFAFATRSVLQAMTVIMAAAAVIAFVGLRRGVQESMEDVPVGTLVTEEA
jgi:predicted MFS family arabinose efflux permease